MVLLYREKLWHKLLLVLWEQSELMYGPLVPTRLRQGQQMGLGRTIIAPRTSIVFTQPYWLLALRPFWSLDYAGFPCGSAGEESAHNVEDLSLIPGLGRSPGERKWEPTPIFLPGKVHRLGLQRVRRDFHSQASVVLCEGKTRNSFFFFLNLGCMISLESGKTYPKARRTNRLP